MTKQARSLVDATVLGFAAVLEAMPRKQRRVAAEYARAFLSAGLVDRKTARIVEGIFLVNDERV